MKMFRILMSVHLESGAFKYSDSLPTFYVHAVNGDHARTMALVVTRALHDKTSGSAIAVDGDGDADTDTYYSWTDL